MDFLEEENWFPRDIEHSSHILSEILLDPSIVDTTITAPNGSSSKFNLLLWTPPLFSGTLSLSSGTLSRSSGTRSLSSGTSSLSSGAMSLCGTLSLSGTLSLEPCLPPGRKRLRWRTWLSRPAPSGPTSRRRWCGCWPTSSTCGTSFPPSSSSLPSWALAPSCLNMWSISLGKGHIFKLITTIQNGFVLRSW